MDDFIQTILGSNPNIKSVCIQISAEEAINLFENIYQKGRTDAEHDLHSSEEETLVTKAEAMSILHRSSNCLWKWNRSGFLKAIKQGGLVMYRMSDIRAIINGEK